MPSLILEKAFLAAAILAVAATERWQCVREDGARRVHGVCSRLRALAVLSPGPTKRAPEIAWRFAGGWRAARTEQAVRRAGVMLRIFSTQPGLACSLVSYMTLVLAAARML